MRFGESAAIIGLGILGQIIAQIADAAAIQVFATDRLSNRCDILDKRGNAHVFSSEKEMQEHILKLTGGQGVDSALLCTSGNSDLIDQSIDWIRDRGKIVIFGDP